MLDNLGPLSGDELTQDFIVALLFYAAYRGLDLDKPTYEYSFENVQIKAKYIKFTPVVEEVRDPTAPGGIAEREFKEISYLVETTCGKIIPVTENRYHAVVEEKYYEVKIKQDDHGNCQYFLQNPITPATQKSAAEKCSPTLEPTKFLNNLLEERRQEWLDKTNHDDQIVNFLARCWHGKDDFPEHDPTSWELPNTTKAYLTSKKVVWERGRSVDLESYIANHPEDESFQLPKSTLQRLQEWESQRQEKLLQKSK